MNQSPKKYTKQHKWVFLFFVFASLVACLLELLLASHDLDIAYIMMLLALSVSFFVESEYPHIYQFGVQKKKMPVNMQILLTLCYFVLMASLIAKFII